VETHPINSEEYRFLMGSDIPRRRKGVPIASGFLPAMRTQQRLYGALTEPKGSSCD